MSAARKLVFRLHRKRLFGRRVLRQRLVPVLLSVPELLRRESGCMILDILFLGGVFLEIAWTLVDWEISISDLEVHSLDLFKQLISLFTQESIVVLVLNMHDELLVALFCTLG